MATTVARLEAYLTANTSQYTRKMREAEGQTTRMGGVMDKAKVAAIGFGVAGVAVAAEALKKSVEAALDAQKVNARLAAAFHDAGLNAKLYAAQIDALDASGRKLGFTDEETKTSLGSLITATGNMSKAAKDLSVAQDVARFRGVALTDATKMLTMAMTGSQRATKQLGINVSPVTVTLDNLKKSVEANITASHQGATAVQDHKMALDFFKTSLGITELAQAKLTDKQLTGDAVIRAVTAHVHGQANAYSQTAAGGMAQFRAQLTHLEVEIGTLLIPTLTKMIGTLNRVIVAAEADWPRYSGSAHVAIQNVKRAVSVGLGNVLANFQVIGGLINGDWHKTWSGVERLLLALVDPLNLRSTNLAHAVWSGFIGGITGGFKAVKDAITGLFGKVIDWAKHALGISSPSAVFHSIGQNVVRGFVHGVGSMSGLLKSAVVGIAKDAIGHLNPLGGGTRIAPGKQPGGGTGNTGGYRASPQQAESFAFQMLPRFGWGSGQFAALRDLWTGESGWSWSARNRSSGAYGIPQALPASKMSSAGPDWKNNAFTQVMWGLNYIKGRYGSPENAYSAWQSRSPHWYDKGGWLPQGLSLAVNNTGRPERVLGPGESGGTFNFFFPGYVGDESVVTAAVRDAMEMFQDRNGRSMGGGF